jgi:hypothetical protein
VRQVFCAGSLSIYSNGKHGVIYGMWIARSTWHDHVCVTRVKPGALPTQMVRSGSVIWVRAERIWMFFTWLYFVWRPYLGVFCMKATPGYKFLRGADFFC